MKKENLTNNFVTNKKDIYQEIEVALLLKTICLTKDYFSNPSDETITALLDYFDKVYELYQELDL